jgi:hypothetical protein
VTERPGHTHEEPVEGCTLCRLRAVARRRPRSVAPATNQPTGDNLVPGGFRPPALTPLDHAADYDFARLAEGWCPYPGHGRLVVEAGGDDEVGQHWARFRWCWTCLIGWSYDPWGPTVALMPAGDPISKDA